MAKPVKKRVLVVGAHRVGKSSLLMALSLASGSNGGEQLTHDELPEFTSISVELVCDGLEIEVELCETVSIENNARANNTFLVDSVNAFAADVFIFCFSLLDRKSFEYAFVQYTTLMSKVLHKRKKSPALLFIGMKKDVRLLSNHYSFYSGPDTFAFLTAGEYNGVDASSRPNWLNKRFLKLKTMVKKGHHKQKGDKQRKGRHSTRNDELSSNNINGSDNCTTKCNPTPTNKKTKKKLLPWTSVDEAENNNNNPVIRRCKQHVNSNSNHNNKSTITEDNNNNTSNNKDSGNASVMPCGQQQQRQQRHEEEEAIENSNSNSSSNDYDLDEEDHTGVPYQHHEPCFVSALSFDNLMHIFCYLDPVSLARCSRVCRAWFKPSQHDSAWVAVYNRTLLHINPSAQLAELCPVIPPDDPIGNIKSRVKGMMLRHSISGDEARDCIKKICDPALPSCYAECCAFSLNSTKSILRSLFAALTATMDKDDAYFNTTTTTTTSTPTPTPSASTSTSRNQFSGDDRTTASNNNNNSNNNRSASNNESTSGAVAGRERRVNTNDTMFPGPTTATTRSSGNRIVRPRRQSAI